MNKSYVQRYVALERSHWWFLVRKKILQGLLTKNLPTKSLKILNVGAAGGASSEWLSDYGEVCSVENDIFFIEYLRSRGTNVIAANVTKLPFNDDTFDLVCAFDVIEHVEDHHGALNELYRVCKNNGYICITVPAFQQLWSHHDVVNGHFRRYHFKQLQSIVQQNISVDFKTWTYFNTILFIPIYLVRKFQKFRGNAIQQEYSDFESYKTGSLINKVLYKLFALEIGWLKFFRLPFGVSLFCFLQKKK